MPSLTVEEVRRQIADACLGKHSSDKRIDWVEAARFVRNFVPTVDGQPVRLEEAVTETVKRGDPVVGRTVDEERRPLVCFVCGTRQGITFNFCHEHKDEYEALKKARQIDRESLAAWFFNNESAEQEADDAKHKQIPKQYARWPEDAALQPYCRWAYRRADAFITQYAAARLDAEVGTERGKIDKFEGDIFWVAGDTETSIDDPDDELDNVAELGAVVEFEQAKRLPNFFGVDCGPDEKGIGVCEYFRTKEEAETRSAEVTR